MDILEKRSKIIFEIRKFFFDKKYIEVETPIRLPSIIPEDHIDPFLSEGWFLQASPEICMKRLLSQGYKKIFQISKAFRKYERGNLHIPEMTMLEWYQTDADYTALMTETEELIKNIAAANKIKKIQRNDKTVNLGSSFQKLSVFDAVKKYTNYSYAQALENFDEIFGIEICPKLGFDKPVFLYNFPASQASLAKLCHDNPNFAQRFELFIAGVEICNCFTELTDAAEQRKRFEDTIENRRKRNQSLSEIPEKFLEDLKKMPQASGNALGIDRLIMLLLNQEKIDDVLTFTPEDL